MKKEQIKSLNGLRIFSLVIVTLYHLYSGSFPGGFLAVQAFFLLSGFFLSYSLENNNNSLITFYYNRFKRLFLPLFLMVTCIVFIAVFITPIMKYKLRFDALSSLTFTNNFYQLSIGQSYFERWSYQSPFVHLYSVAIEAQFNLVWPIILMIINSLTKNNKQTKLPIFILIFFGFVFYSVYFINTSENLSAFYYRPDTRFFGLIAGVLTYYIYQSLKEKNIRLKSLFSSILEITIIIFLFYNILNVSETDISTYQTVIYLFTFLLMILVITLSLGSGIISIFFSHKFFEILSNRSYEAYLWQYSLMIVFQNVFSSSKLTYDLKVFIQLLILIIITELFYRAKTLFTLTSFKIVLPLFVSGILILGLVNSPSEIPYNLRSDLVSGSGTDTLNNTIDLANKQKELDQKDIPNDKEAPVTSRDDSKDSSKVQEIDTSFVNQYFKKYPISDKDMLALSKIPVTFVGDSVFKLVEPNLKQYFKSMNMNAAISRQAYHYIEILSELKNNKQLHNVVVLTFGNNGRVSNKTINQIMDILKDKTVYLITVSVPASWQDSVNQKLWETSQIYQNVTIIDWYSFAKEKPELFYHDMVHPNIKGARVYARLIAYEILQAMK